MNEWYFFLSWNSDSSCQNWIVSEIIVVIFQQCYCCRFCFDHHRQFLFINAGAASLRTHKKKKKKKARDNWPIMLVVCLYVSSRWWKRVTAPVKVCLVRIRLATNEFQSFFSLFCLFLDSYINVMPRINLPFNGNEQQTSNGRQQQHDKHKFVISLNIMWMWMRMHKRRSIGLNSLFLLVPRSFDMVRSRARPREWARVCVCVWFVSFSRVHFFRHKCVSVCIVLMMSFMTSLRPIYNFKSPN